MDKLKKVEEKNLPGVENLYHPSIFHTVYTTQGCGGTCKYPRELGGKRQGTPSMGFQPMAGHSHTHHGQFGNANQPLEESPKA